MKILLRAITALMLATACQSASPPIEREVSFVTTDGVTVFADWYRTRSRAPVVLLFHQGGGDARGEYGPIIPWLLDKGFNVIAVDLRLGGDRFGGTNRTAAAVTAARYSYCDAYADLQAALRFSQRVLRAKPIVWGSSYSATLALKLAAEQPNAVTAVLAFSPAGGEPMRGCEINDYVDELTVPALVLRAPQEMEVPWIREQTAILAKGGIDVYVPPVGAHGSSMLVPERVKAPVTESRQRVHEFLAAVTNR